MSGSRKESERTKFIQEKCQTLLTSMLRDEDNKYCVDCDSKGPRWASWNLGVFLCIRCAGIHRNLGVHISRVKSVNLDTWTPEQVVSLEQMGNSRARAVYEAQLPDGFRRPQTDSALESFIRAKYEQKKYVAREWVPPSPVKVNWDKEIEEEMEKQRRKKKGLSGTSTLKTSDITKASIIKSAPIPAPLPKPTTNLHSPKTRGISNGQHTVTNEPKAPTSEVNALCTDLLGLTTSETKASASDDVFGCFFSSPPIANANGSTTVTDQKTQAATLASNQTKQGTQLSLAQEEQDFFNQIPTEKEKAKLTNDSILALYSQTPTMNQFNPLSTNPIYPSQMMINNMPAGGNPMFNSGAVPMQYANPINSFSMYNSTAIIGNQQKQQQPQQPFMGN